MKYQANSDLYIDENGLIDKNITKCIVIRSQEMKWFIYKNKQVN